MKKQLLIGCGNGLIKRLHANGETEWQDLVTLDINPDAKPDVCHDLEVMPLPFEDNTFDEIHAYGVLEHTGSQGDYKAFFAEFSEYHRILKPGGLLLAIVPNDQHVQQWGDPSHRRVINLVTLSFLSQANYEQCGQTMMTDFRNIYHGDLIVTWVKDDEEARKEGLLYFSLQAIKEVPGWTSENTPKE